MALSLQRYIRPDENSRLTQLLKERSRKEKEKSMSIAIMEIDHLPESLIIEILSWLPVKDVLQWKSVSKSWYAIISSRDFISKHLNNYYNNNDDWCSCLLVQHYVSNAEIELYELLLDETPQILCNEALDRKPMDSCYVCGPCNGLYYVYHHDFSGRALWNPAMNEFKPLPKLICKPDLSPKFTYARYEVYGFGLDPVTGDYKVVVIKGYWSTTDDDSDVRPPLSVLVYSFRTNSWKYCGDLAEHYDLDINKCYINVNGCFYWLGYLGIEYEYMSDVIISFDMATDAFKEMNVPEYLEMNVRCGDLQCSRCLALYDHSLAFLSLHNYEKNLDIWTWNEGSWTKKLTVGPFPDVWAPIGHWKGNRLILQFGYGRLALLDPETQELKDLGFANHMACQGVYAYMESLVSIKDKNEEIEAQDTA